MYVNVEGFAVHDFLFCVSFNCNIDISSVLWYIILAYNEQIYRLYPQIIILFWVIFYILI